MQSGILSSLILMPLLAAGLILLLPKVYKASYKWISIITLILMAINIGTLVGTFDKSVTDYQFLEHYEWIRLSLGNKAILSVDYIIGLDGLSLSMIVLTIIVFLAANISSFQIEKKEKAYYGLFLLLLTAVIGCFVSVDFFLFFVFFEFMLLPMYFLIGIWGGPNKAYASLKFIIYTLVGSVLILVVMIALAMSNADEFFSNEYKRLVYSFDFRILKDSTNLIKGSVLSLTENYKLFGIPARHLMFWFLIIGFGIKLPMVPFHTWLPDAHVEAPTPISVVLAGILLKIGGYGFLRIAYDFFPIEFKLYAPSIAIFGLVSIIYGGFNALAQKDLKKLIAYSSVSHMGFVMVGMGAINSEGINGAVFQMFSHGILSSMLFLVAGVLYDRTHDRNIDNYKGLAKQMPIFTLLVAVAFFGSMGLPSLPGFIGEFFSLFGAFQSEYLSKSIAIFGVTGILISAVYLLWTFQKMFFGEFKTLPEHEGKLIDLQQREIFTLGTLAIFSFVIGIYPKIIFDFINPYINYLLK